MKNKSYFNSDIWEFNKRTEKQKVITLQGAIEKILMFVNEKFECTIKLFRVLGAPIKAFSIRSTNSAAFCVLQ